MDTGAIRHELHDYIDKATDKRVEEIYAIVKGDNSETHNWWEDEELVEELERRSADLKSGKDKGVTLEESMARIKARLQKNG
jgi:putative addiction module component (TIGR02574 family)